jgi:hypothetical protein
MKTIRSLSALAVVFGLIGFLPACTATQATAVTNDLSAATQDVQALCKAGSTLITGAQALAPSPTSSAGVLLASAQSACTVDGAVANTLAPNFNATTPAWLTGVLQGLQTAAALEPVVLPAITAVTAATK